jgi:hypothetical protein
MLAVDYRDLINRDLPPIERGCTSKIAYGSRDEARSFGHGRRSNGQLHP